MKICDFKVYGFSGQGIRTFVKLLEKAYMLSGWHVFGSFTVGSPGKPASGYVRVSNRKVLDKGPSENPDFVIIMDKDFYSLEDIKDRGVIIVNSSEPVNFKKELKNKKVKIYSIDATTLALGLGLSMPNTVMLGIVAKKAGLKINTVKKAASGMNESNHKAIEEGFKK